MRATLYRDSDEYQGQSLRLLMMILRQLTYLIREGYVVNMPFANEWPWRT